jgi:hypothetical protein
VKRTTISEDSVAPEVRLSVGSDKHKKRKRLVFFEVFIWHARPLGFSSTDADTIVQLPDSYSSAVMAEKATSTLWSEIYVSQSSSNRH